MRHTQVQQLVQAGAGNNVCVVAVRLPPAPPPPSMPSLSTSLTAAPVPQPISTAASGAGLVPEGVTSKPAGEAGGAPMGVEGKPKEGSSSDVGAAAAQQQQQNPAAATITPLAFVSPTTLGPWAPKAPAPAEVKGYGAADGDDTRRVQLMLMYTGRMAEVK